MKGNHSGKKGFSLHDEEEKRDTTKPMPVVEEEKESIPAGPPQNEMDVEGPVPPETI